MCKDDTMEVVRFLASSPLMIFDIIHKYETSDIRCKQAWVGPPRTLPPNCRIGRQPTLSDTFNFENLIYLD